jgi:ABC-2 type transport system ATP-binding protein
MKIVIEINELTVRYGKLTAVDRISMSVPRGEIFGLVGPNGAGKTTTLKVLAGLLRPDGGRVSIDGLDVVERRIDVQRRIGYMVDFFGVYDHLSVTEYLEFFGRVYGVADEALAARIDELLQLSGLAHKKSAMVHELSRGMKQRLYFARALVHRPALLILDEPASGMDPRGRSELMASLRRINADGQTIVISSHILDELEDICSSVGIMEMGHMAGFHGRSADSAVGTRCVALLVHGGDESRAREMLVAMDGVERVEPGHGHLLLTIRDSDETVAAAVAALARSGIRVLLPTVSQLNLEDAFFRMTRGETT